MHTEVNVSANTLQKMRRHELLQPQRATMGADAFVTRSNTAQKLVAKNMPSQRPLSGVFVLQTFMSRIVCAESEAE